MNFLSLSTDSIQSLLQQTNSGIIPKHVEDNLMAFREDPTYLVYLLDILASSQDNATLVTAVIEFKNTVHLHWLVQKLAGFDAVHLEAVKRIVPVLLNSSPLIADYVAEALVIIASAEYPKDWPTLMQELVTHMDDQNHEKNFRLWMVIKNITKKYPLEERSDDLYREINITLDSIHGKLLYYAQGYLSQLNNIQDTQLLHQCLKIYKVLLKTFFNINSQDLPALVEDNLQNWATILKEVLAKKINMQNISSNEIDYLWFECKGEAIKSALMFATKYQDDFMDAIKPFANEIWNICQESTADEKFTKILVNSMKYFKSFCESPKFMDFFNENVKMMFTKVIIPNMTPGEDVLNYFESEHQAFVESILANKEYGERSETVCQFIKSLARFHNEQVEDTLKIVLSEYMQVMHQSPSLPNEIVCINLICFSCVLGFRQDVGVVEINMHKELIESTYSQLIKPRLGPIFEAIAKGEDVNNLNPNTCSPILICYDLKFVSLFRNFISPEELLEIGVYCSGLLKMNSPPVQKIAITLLGQILSCKEREINDNMNARVDDSSFYAKFYMNPRKVKVKIHERRIYNSGNVFPSIETILQNLYNYVSSKSELEPASLFCLEKIFKVLEDKVSGYCKPLSEMFKVLFKQLVNGYTYDGLKNIFESLGTFISNSKGSNEAQQIIFTDILNEVNELMNKGINDVNCFLLQIYAIIIQTFGDMPEATMNVLITSLVSDKYTSGEYVVLFPAYATFFEELIYAKPQILVTYSEAIKSLAVKMANAHIDQSFFGILNAVFEVLNIGDLKSSGWMNFHVASLMSVVSSIPADIGGQSYRPLYFKEYAFLILKFGLKHSFTGIFRTNSGYFMAVESEQKGTTAAVLSFQPLHVFMRFFKRIPEVRIVTLGLTKLLTEDFGVFQELGITEIWQMLFVTLLRNIFSRSSMATGSLKQNWDNIARTNEVQTSSDVLQQRHMQQIKGLGDNSAFTRLQALAPKPDKVLLQIKDMKESDMRVSMDRVREFLKGPGSNLNYDFLDQYLKELIDKFPN